MDEQALCPLAVEFEAAGREASRRVSPSVCKNATRAKELARPFPGPLILLVG